jgi:hypothetical protein
MLRGALGTTDPGELVTACLPPVPHATAFVRVNPASKAGLFVTVTPGVSY